MKERDISKLPKWAQSRIKQLEGTERYLRKILEQGPENSRVFANPYSESKRPLGESDISFDMGDEISDHHMNQIRVRLVKAHEGYMVEVYGGDQLQVYPQSSNVIRVRLGRFM